MNISEETLMAYADGELDAQARAAIEAAIKSDPQLAQQVARLQRQRSELNAAFADTLHEPVPEQLVTTALTARAGVATNNVTDLASVRAAKSGVVQRRWSLPEWAAIAASVILGIAIGRNALQPSSDLILAKDGQIVAGGTLAAALSEQPAGAQDADVQIPISFKSKSGEYCRSFAIRGTKDVAGLACRDDVAWRVEVLAQTPASTDSSGSYRMAGGELPTAVLQAIEQQIAGEPFSAEEEEAARERGWR